MPKGQMTPLKSKKSMSIFRHMTNGKYLPVFLRFISGECHYCLLFYGYDDKLNTIYLCGHVFDLCIENV